MTTWAAVRFAFWLGLILNVRGETAVGGGWVARARRLLESQPDDIVERGYLLTHEFFQHLGRGRLRQGRRDGRSHRRDGSPLLRTRPGRSRVDDARAGS